MTEELNGTAPGAQQASLALPRVSLDTAGPVGDMKPALRDLGMGEAFSPAADFRALSPKATGLGFVQQAATLKVGEKGTVASAAAAGGITGLLAPGPPGIAFDRPYLMLITSTSTGDPLFLATVANPAGS